MRACCGWFAAAALPGATLLELGEWGIRRAMWDGLELVRSWRDFLDQPQRYLHHLLAGDSASGRPPPG
jgi:hypothetical protein